LSRLRVECENELRKRNTVDSDSDMSVSSVDMEHSAVRFLNENTLRRVLENLNTVGEEERQSE